MALDIRVEDAAALTKRVYLKGRLDNEALADFERQVEAVLAAAVKVVVLDLSGLEYITSDGLRIMFKAQKAMKARAGKLLLINPQPTVQKVMDIMKVLEVSVFKSVQELDAYLDAMQKKVAEGD